MWIKEVKKQVNLLSYQWKTHLMNEEFLWVLTWENLFWSLWKWRQYKGLGGHDPHVCSMSCKNRW
jgi:hypothetical protein